MALTLKGGLLAIRTQIILKINVLSLHKSKNHNNNHRRKDNQDVADLSSEKVVVMDTKVEGYEQ